MPRKAITPISSAVPRGHANERVPPSTACASAMRPARGSSTAASTMAAATWKCKGTDGVRLVMPDAKNAPAIVPMLNIACRRDMTGHRRRALHLHALRVHRDVHRAREHAVQAHHDAGQRPVGRQPEHDQPDGQQAARPQARAARAELVQRCRRHGKREDGAERREQQHHAHLRRAQAEVGLDRRQARRPGAVAEAQRAEQRGDRQLAASGGRGGARGGRVRRSRIRTWAGKRERRCRMAHATRETAGAAAGN